MDAGYDLFITKGINNTVIDDIVKKAGVAKGTFYLYFKDKYDLVNWIFYTEFIQSVQYTDYENAWGFLEDICRYFFKEQAFYRNAMQIQGQNSFREYFSEVMAPFIDIFLQSIFHREPHSAFFQTFLSDAFLASLMRWLSDGVKIAPEEYLSNLKLLLVEVSRQVMQDYDAGTLQLPPLPTGD